MKKKIKKKFAGKEMQLQFSLVYGEKRPNWFGRHRAQAAAWAPEESSVDSRQGQQCFLISSVFRPALGTTEIGFHSFQV